MNWSLSLPSLFVWIFSMIFLNCTLNTQAPVKVPEGFDWQGHRGCRGLMPENTVPAFLHALTFPAIQTLELDLAVSKDGQLIVSHEPWFNPGICSQPNGAPITNEESEFLIFHFTAAEISGFDCGSQGNLRFPQQQKVKTYKPTLKEVVETIQAADSARFANLYWNIEIKSNPDWDGIRTPPVDSFAHLTLKTIRELGIATRTTIQSFDVRALQAVKKIDSAITLALLVENAWGVQKNINKLGFTPQIYSPYYKLVSRKTRRKCHNLGMKLIPWTVNDVNSMRSLIRIGVDGIITDYPNLIEQVSR